jgi:CheY-like chemotaxis protein
MTKVLVVDDDEDVRALLRTRLSAGNRFAVLEVESGEKAITAAIEEKPDVILCDIDMPKMDGLTVAERLSQRETTKQIPLIFLSSLVTKEEAQRGVQAGKWPTLSKQSTFQEIADAIERVVKLNSRRR